MNLYQTNLLIIALGALALLLIALAGGFKSPALFMAGLAAFVAVGLVDFIHPGRRELIFQFLFYMA